MDYKSLYISCKTDSGKYIVLDRSTEPATKVKTCRSYSQARKFLDTVRLDSLKEIGKQKRQRNVFPSDEVPHLWYHKTQDSARNAGRNLYFENETIYSYGGHFPIARHVTVGRKSAVLFTTRTYSNTTAKQCGMVRSAIPESATVFSVPFVVGAWGSDSHEDNLASYVKASEKALDKATRAISSGAYLLGLAFENRDNARAYARFFKVSCPKFDFLPKGKVFRTLKAKLAERKARHDAAFSAAQVRAEARREEQNRIARLEFSEQAELWKAGNANVRLSYISGVDTLLRITGNEVETSRGARIPVSHAKRGLAFVRKVMASGQEYVRNGHTLHLGHYSIDKITTDGTLTAGCHVIKFAEIARLALALDNLTVAPEVSEDLGVSNV